MIVADASINAWNNFICKSEPDAHEMGSPRWAAAIAAQFMGLACNGGLYYFLDCSSDLDAREAARALHVIGAMQAASRLGFILDQLGRPLPSSTAEERERILHECWSEPLNEIDSLSDSAYSELLAALEAHVEAEASFYLGLDVAGARARIGRCDN